jgi:drug/metabolite transporter (DMT)-like permease
MWILVITIGYLLNAISSLVNKILLNKAIPNPVVYTFYTTLLGLAVFLLAPFGFGWIGLELFIISIISGALFTYALLTMFMALARDDVSRVTPLIGGLQPIFVFLLAYLILGERLVSTQLFAFLLIIAGGILVTVQLQKSSIKQFRMFFISLLSSFLFAASFVSTKYVFDGSDFVSGFIWIRIGSFVAAAVLLLSAANRKAIFHSNKSVGKSTSITFLVGQTAGALSFIMINWAISLGSVTFVNALQGMQYVFLFILVFVVAYKRPDWLGEDMSKKVIVQKIIAIFLIAVGMYFIV